MFALTKCLREKKEQQIFDISNLLEILEPKNDQSMKIREHVVNILKKFSTEWI